MWQHCLRSPNHVWGDVLKSAPTRRRKRKASTPAYLCYVVRPRVRGRYLPGIENFGHFLIEASDQMRLTNSVNWKPKKRIGK